MTTGDVIASLEAAATAYREAIDAVEAYGEANLQTVADAHDEFTGLLARYADSATGSGDFQAYVEFQDNVQRLVDGLPEDLPARDAFEQAADILDQRRLTESDFDRARDALEPATNRKTLLDDRTTALKKYRSARRALTERHRTITDRINRLESLKEYGTVDFSADLDVLQEPIETYDAAIEDAFNDYRSSAPARDFMEFLEATTAYPLVSFPQPPTVLSDYLTSHQLGKESVSTLLEYADYSPSKLDYYVDDPQDFRAHIGANRTYLVSLDAAPLQIGWPPPPADDLRWFARELVAVVDRFAPGPVVAALHDVRRLTYKADYEQYRRAALANEDLTPDEREKLETGAVDQELKQLREEQSRLADALAAHPDR